MKDYSGRFCLAYWLGIIALSRTFCLNPLMFNTMPLLSFPNELLLLTAENLQAGDVRSLLHTNRRLYLLLTPLLPKLATDEEYAMTALFWAAAKGDEAMIRRILENATGVVVVNIGGYKSRESPRVFHSAPAKCSRPTIDFVVWKGLELVLEGKDHNESTDGLQWAVIQGREAMVRFMLDRGANIEANNSFMLDSIVALDQQRDPRDRVGGRQLWKPLHLAAHKGHVGVVKALLEKNASLAAKDDRGRTPLHIAACCGREAIVSLLLESGANIDPEDNFGRTPLYLAAENNQDVMMVLLLLKHGANINHVGGRDDASLLQLAVARGLYSTAKLLLKVGANVNYRNPSTGYTALHMVTWSTRSNRLSPVARSLARLLLDYGADLTIRDAEGNTAIQRGKIRCNLEFVEMLLQEEVNVTTTTVVVRLETRKNASKLKGLVRIGGWSRRPQILG